jgi:hypothetical protein
VGIPVVLLLWALAGRVNASNTIPRGANNKTQDTLASADDREMYFDNLIKD